MRKKINLISAFIGVIFMYGFSLLPHWILYGISDFAFILVYRIFGYRKKVVYENLKNSFPEKSHEALKEIEEAFFHNLTDVMIETVKEFTLSKKAVKKRYKFINPEVFERHFEQGKSVMMLMGHYTNWEYGVSVPLWVPQECWAVYGKIQNKVMDKYLVRTREKFGMTLYPMEETNM